MKRISSQIETRPHHKPFAFGSRTIRSRVLQVLLAVGAFCFSSLAARAQSLYVANENTNTVTEFNAATGKTVPTFQPATDNPYGLALSGSSLYVSNYLDGTVNEYNATTGATIAGFTAPTGLGLTTGPRGLRQHPLRRQFQQEHRLRVQRHLPVLLSLASFHPPA